MEAEARSETPLKRRDLDLEAHIKAVEKAARDWGVNVDELEGKFVGALLAAIAASGRANIAAIGDLERLLEASRAAGDVELRRLRILLDGGAQVLGMARQAAETAVAGGNRAEREFDKSVALIARELSTKLLSESQKWLVLKQTSRNRRDAWRLAFVVAGLGLGLFIGGYGARAQQDAAALEGFFEAQARIAECAAAPLWVNRPKGEPGAACWLEQVAGKRGESKPPGT